MTYLILIPIIYAIALIVDIEFYDCDEEIRGMENEANTKNNSSL
jgi:hypothetical protein